VNSNSVDQYDSAGNNTSEEAREIEALRRVVRAAQVYRDEMRWAKTEEAVDRAYCVLAGTLIDLEILEAYRPSLTEDGAIKEKGEKS
jgi:hypothetical protein